MIMMILFMTMIIMRIMLMVMVIVSMVIITIMRFFQVMMERGDYKYIRILKKVIKTSRIERFFYKV